MLGVLSDSCTSSRALGDAEIRVFDLFFANDLVTARPVAGRESLYTAGSTTISSEREAATSIPLAHKLFQRRPLAPAEGCF